MLYKDFSRGLLWLTWELAYIVVPKLSDINSGAGLIVRIMTLEPVLEKVTSLGWPLHIFLQQVFKCNLAKGPYAQ